MKLPQIPVKIRIYKWPTGLDGDKSRKLKSILWTDKCQWLQTEKSKDISITFPMGNEIPWILRMKSCRQWLIPESNSADRKYISNWKQHDAKSWQQLWSTSPEATRKLTQRSIRIRSVSSKMTFGFQLHLSYNVCCAKSNIELIFLNIHTIESNRQLSFVSKLLWCFLNGDTAGHRWKKTI
jgi:hypothetical protein